MVAYIREANTARSVTDCFEQLWAVLGEALFMKLFPVILTDRGSEFTDPSAIELAPGGQTRARVFFCDPQASYQKGAAENNHEFIRRIIPKGRSLDRLTQDDISLMMNHINSYARKSLNGKTPFELFSYMCGEETPGLFGIAPVASQDVTLRPSLLKR